MPVVFTSEHRRTPIVLIAVWLVVLQAFLAGIVTARAGAALASTFIDAAICHATGDANPGDRNPAETAWHLCCASCISAAPLVLSCGAAAALPLPAQCEARAVSFTGFTLVIARGAVRAGPSQAPPKSRMRLS